MASAMKVYIGQTKSRKWLRKPSELGFGEMTCRPALMPKRLPFALDNGAYSDWVHHRVFDESAFVEHVELVMLAGFRPDFIVVPDIVAAGLESLRFSLEWLPRLKPLVGNIPLYLAVQNGMTEQDIWPHLGSIQGLFVGGTDPWKKATVGSWVQLAHENGLLCHMGRAGTFGKVSLALEVGVDSIDSSLPIMSQQFFDDFLAALRGEDKPLKGSKPSQHPCKKQLDLWNSLDQQ
jgi:hypothetical protein